MKAAIKFLSVILATAGGLFLLSSFLGGTLSGTTFPIHTLGGALNGTQIPAFFRFPYRQAGLTERQAAAHLLSRFTYGATPGQIDEVVHQGLENWFNQQLEGGLPDDSLRQVLGGYDALNLSNEEVGNIYPKNGQVIRMAIRDGYIDKDSVKTDRKAYRDVIRSYMEQKGYKPEQELVRQFISQKVLRAACSQNQLQEVMTDFWFNHFNVSITKNDCAGFIPAYERDVIRPGALGHFDDLLLKTAKSPAMLYYLDNFSSSGPAPDNAGRGAGMGRRRLAGNGVQANPGVGNGIQGDRTQENASQASGAQMMNAEDELGRQGLAAVAKDLALDTGTTSQLQKARKSRGLNENYAREVMELHTLGVDGGYTQQDVTQAARVLTGWTVYPLQKEGKAFVDKIGEDRMVRQGFVHDGDFLFNANRHDKGEKIVLGKHFGPDGGYQEGVDLLKMLAHYPATARFVTRKIAVRFVSDDPSPALVDKMTKTFLDKGGDIRQVLVTMASAPEFWSAAAIREKTKSPFELAIGAVRALHGAIYQPYQLYNWVSKMGERKYYYQAPTGFPDKGAYWINTGSLLYRMNFGLALAAGRIPGVSIDLAALNDHHEPESAQAALAIYGRLIMPERNLDETIRRLTPMLNDPGLAKKVDAAAAHTASPGNAGDQEMSYDRRTAGPDSMAVAMNGKDNPMLAQVVGIIIGSPEYQRR